MDKRRKRERCPVVISAEKIRGDVINGLGILTKNNSIVKQWRRYR